MKINSLDTAKGIKTFDQNRQIKRKEKSDLPFLPATTTCVCSLLSASEYAGPSCKMCPLPLEAAVATMGTTVVSAAAGTTAVIVRRCQVLENAFVISRGTCVLCWTK